MATRRAAPTTTETDEIEDEGAPPGIAVEVDPPAPTPTPTPGDPNSNGGKTYTEAELIARIEEARKQEKDKLYPRLEETSNVVAELKADLDERNRIAEEARRAAQEAEAARQREEADAKTLIDEMKSNFDRELAEVRNQLVGTQAMWQKEQEFQTLSQIRQQKIDAALAANPLAIADEFIDYVGGNNEEEIEQSLAMAMQKTASIVAQVQGAQRNTRQQAKGASVTAPPVGPMETDQAFEMMSPEDIQNMSMEDYAKRRPALLRAASRAANPGAR